MEQRVQLITDIENLHTFSNIISRTRRRDIGEFTLRKPITVPVEFTVEQKILHDSILSVLHDMLSHIHCTDNTKFMMTTIRRQTAWALWAWYPPFSQGALPAARKAHLQACGANRLWRRRAGTARAGPERGFPPRCRGCRRF